MRTYHLRLSWPRKRRFIGGLAFLLCCLTVQPILAQEAEIREKGKRLYQRYCAVCHGDQGKGDGSMSEQLKVMRPADLTTLTKRHGEPFPFWRTYRIIDGREATSGHGPRDMPIWGDWFRIVEGQNEDAVRGRIWQLIYYLESIQEKGM